MRFPTAAPTVSPNYPTAPSVSPTHNPSPSPTLSPSSAPTTCLNDEIYVTEQETPTVNIKFVAEKTVTAADDFAMFRDKMFFRTETSLVCSGKLACASTDITFFNASTVQVLCNGTFGCAESE